MNDEQKSTQKPLRASPKKRAYERQESEEKGEVGEFAKTAIIAILLALFIRTFFFEPFNIPSGSMLPTLKVGDYLFVSKSAYGYSKHSFPFSMGGFEGRIAEKEPKRGDPVVFKLPTNTSIDYIKRVIGLPRDTVQVIQGRLYINGEQIERESIGLAESDANSRYETRRLNEYIETLPDGTKYHIFEESDGENLDNTPIYTVPYRHVFVMGDNRDNSQDSRVSNLVGFVPYENLVGRADILFFSIDKNTISWNPLTWPKSIRFNRVLRKLSPERSATNPSIAQNE